MELFNFSLFATTLYFNSSMTALSPLFLRLYFLNKFSVLLRSLNTLRLADLFSQLHSLDIQPFFHQGSLLQCKRSLALIYGMTLSVWAFTFSSIIEPQINEVHNLMFWRFSLQHFPNPNSNISRPLAFCFHHAYVHSFNLLQLFHQKLQHSQSLSHYYLSIRSIMGFATFIIFFTFYLSLDLR